MTRAPWRDRVDAIRRPARGAWYRVGRRRDRIVDAVVRRKDGVVYRVGYRRYRIVRAVAARKDGVLYRVADRRDRILDWLAVRKDTVLYRVGERRDRIVEALAVRKDGTLDRIEDAWISVNDRVPHARRILGGTAALIGIVSVAVLWTSVQGGVSGPTAATGSGRLSVPASSAPANLSTVESGSPTSPTLPSTSSTGVGAADAPSPIETIQLVPPLRDVIVVVDDVELVSDERGAIGVPDQLRRGTFSFVGAREQPPLRRVAFAQWSDGNPSDERSLSDVAGPVAVIGVVEQRRVTIWTSIETPSGSEVRLDTQAGPVSLPVGTPTWVDAERAADAGGILVSEELRYTAAEVLLGGTIRSIPNQVFSPTPEALWVVDVDIDVDVDVAVNPMPDPMSSTP